MSVNDRFTKVRKDVIKVMVLGVALGSVGLLSACSSNQKSDSGDASSKTESVSSKKAKTSDSKKSSSEDAQDQASSESTESSVTQSSSNTNSTAQSSSSAASASSSSTATITSGDQAATYLKQQVDSQYQNVAGGTTVYGYTSTTTYQGQTAYRVEVGKNNGRSTIAIYYVLANGQIVKIS